MRGVSSVIVLGVFGFLAWTGGAARGQCEPELIGRIALFASDVEIEGDLAFVAADGGGVQIVDVSVPEEPQIIARVPELTGTLGIERRGDLLFAADFSRGLVVIDTSDARRPRVIAAMELASPARDLVISGDLAIVHAYDALFLVDVSDPSVPVLLGTFAGEGLAGGGVVSGEIMYATSTESDGVLVLDISDPSEPAAIGAAPTLADPGSMRLIGDRLFVATSGGVELLDVSDRRRPTAIASLRTATRVEDIDVLGDLGFLAMGPRTMWIIDLATLDRTRIIGFKSFDEGSMLRVRARDGRAFVGGGEGGLRVVDVVDPANPTEIASLRGPYLSGEIEVRDGVAYVLDNEGARLLAIDVSDPSFPRVLASLALGGRGETIELDASGETLYISDEDRGIVVVDVSEPMGPELRGVVPVLGAGTHEVLRRGERLYARASVGNDPVLAVLDLGEPQSPSLIGAFEQFFLSFDVVDGVAYLAGAEPGLRVVDVTDPASPVVVGAFEVSSPARAWDVVVRDGLAYLAVSRDDAAKQGRRGQRAGLYILDVRDPGRPTLLGRGDVLRDGGDHFLRSPYRGVEVHRGVAYIRDREHGTFLFDARNPLHPRFLGELAQAALTMPTFVGDLAYVSNDALSILDVSTCGSCPADLDGDGDADADDLFAYLDAFARGDSAVCDRDGDGDCEADDYFAFLDLFARGC